MNATVSRMMAALVLTGCMAGQATATPEDGQYEDWRVVATFPFGQVWSMSVAPSDSSRVYAFVYDGFNSGAREGELHRSSNGGDTWTQVLAVSGVCPEQELAINPADKNLILGCRQNEDYSMLRRSADAGANWSDTLTTSGAPLWDPNDSDIVYARKTLWNSASGYVLRSVDKGVTWTTWFSWPWNGVSAADTNNLATPIIYCAADRVYRLAGAKSSTNVVVTDITGNLPADLDPSAHSCMSYYTGCWNPKLPSQIIVYTSPTQSGLNTPITSARVFRATNATELAVSWQEVTTNGLPSGGYLGFFCSPDDGAFYANYCPFRFSQPDYPTNAPPNTNSVFRSDDGGWTWAPFKSGLDLPGNRAISTAGASIGWALDSCLALDPAGKRLYCSDFGSKGAYDSNPRIWRTRVGPILNIVGATNPATGAGAGGWTNWRGTAVSHALPNTVVNGTNLCAYWSLSGGQTDTNGAIVGKGSVNFTHTRDTTLTLQWLPVTASNTFVGVLAGPGGTVSPAGAAAAFRGVPVVIAATASNGYAFASWQTMAGTASFGDSNVAATTVAVDAPATIRANFHDRKHILTTATSLAVAEGGTATFQVKLAGLPAGEVQVAVARESGDADLQVQAGTT